MKIQCLLLLTLFVGAQCVRLLKKTNVMNVVDVGESNRDYSERMAKKYLNGMSLLKFRIAMFTTSGLNEKITDFQSRECLLGKLKATGPRYLQITTPIRWLVKDMNNVFNRDKIVMLILTDKPLYHKTIAILNKIAKDPRTIAIRINAIKGKHPYRKSYSISHSYYYGFPRHRHHIYESRRATTPKLNPKITVSTIKNVDKLFERNPFFNKDLKKCRTKKPILDECNRKCECVNGRLVNCVRVRKEFSSMSLTERQRFINVYKALSTSTRFRKLYYTYVKYHVKNFFKGLHAYRQFLPWHRRYILGFENYLRLYDCRVTVPYWNWALHHQHAWKVTPSHHIWREKGGLGGNGYVKDGYCVKGGEFGKSKWKVPKYEKAETMLDYICNTKLKGHWRAQKICNQYINRYSRCLRRRFNGKTPTYGNLYKTIKNYKVYQFKKFEHRVRIYWHNGMHNKLGGQMETDYSSHTPEFWMHHGMLDCAWEKWQQKGHRYKYGFFNNKKVKLLAIKPTEYRYKYVQNDNLGGCGIRVTCENVLPKPLPKPKPKRRSRYYHKSYYQHRYYKKYRQ